MPSKSKKQKRFMAAVDNNPKFAKKVGVSQEVGREFADADKGRNFAGGGVMPSYFNSKSGRPGKAVKKYREGNMVSRRSERRDLRDEEARVIGEQDDHADELRRIKGDRGRNRRDEKLRVGREERDERDEMHRLRDKAVGLGMKKGGAVQTKKDRSDESKGSKKPRGWGIARKGWAGRY